MSDFMRGPFPSRMSGLRIAECAATWISSGFPTSMERVRLPGCSACFIFPPIVALPAGTAFSRSVRTGASYLYDASRNQERRRIRSRSNGIAPAGKLLARTGCRPTPPLDYSAASYENYHGVGLARLFAVRFWRIAVAPSDLCREIFSDWAGTTLDLTDSSKLR
jgi:hypothetical protein